MKQISIPKNNSPQRPTSEQIAVVAFHFYVENGYQDGRALDDWLKAEELLTQKMNTVNKVQASKPNQAAISNELKVTETPTPERSMRDEKDNRAEIRQTATPKRPASRQPQWQAKHPAHIKHTA